MHVVHALYVHVMLQLHLIGTVTGKTILNKEYLWKYLFISSVLQTWHQKCSSQVEQNNTCCAVAMTTVLRQVLS